MVPRNRPGKLILLVGLGSVGALVLDLLLRLPGNHRFLVGGRNPHQIRERSNVALFAANQVGYYPEVECLRVDLANVDETADLLAGRRPDLVFCAASLQPWGRSAS